MHHMSNGFMCYLLIREKLFVKSMLKNNFRLLHQKSHYYHILKKLQKSCKLWLYLFICFVICFNFPKYTWFKKKKKNSGVCCGMTPFVNWSFHVLGKHKLLQLNYFLWAIFFKTTFSCYTTSNIMEFISIALYA